MLSFPMFAKFPPAFQSHANSFPLIRQFRRPFFSYTYKLPLAQPLSFDIHAFDRGYRGVFLFENLKCYLKFSSSGCALPSLFSLFTPRVFANPSAIKRIRTLSENSRVYGDSNAEFLKYYFKSAAISSRFSNLPKSRAKERPEVILSVELSTFNCRSEVPGFWGPEIPTGSGL